MGTSTTRSSVFSSDSVWTVVVAAGLVVAGSALVAVTSKVGAAVARTVATTGGAGCFWPDSVHISTPDARITVASSHRYQLEGLAGAGARWVGGAV